MNAHPTKRKGPKSKPVVDEHDRGGAVGRPDDEPADRRGHGDSYSEIVTDSSDPSTNESTHSAPVARWPEEPAETPLGASERLEGDL